MDTYLEESLNGAIFDWVEAQACHISEQNKDKNTIEQKNSSTNDIGILQDYKEDAEKQIERYKKMNKKLLQEYMYNQKEDT
jgi:hypothetical protein